jgi:hypothetical protein
MRLVFVELSKIMLIVRGHKPISRSFFAAKIQGIEEQSVYFNTLSIWLLGLCGGQMGADKKYEDPVTMATNLLNEMTNVGIQCDVPPNKLRTVIRKYN